MSMENSLQFIVGADLTPFNRGIEGAIDRVVRLGKVAVGVGLAAVATAIGKTGLDSLKAASQMETYETKLATLMGSAQGATARMDELFKLAATTPFNTDQIVAAEVTLRGFGAAADEIMPGLIDFAATTGADLSQSALDISNAWNQGAAGLQSDTGKMLKNHISLRAGIKATDLTLEEFRAAMIDTLDNDSLWAGGAARMSRTFAGMVSNLQDSWDAFLRDVGKGSELFDNVKGALAAILDLINKNQNVIHAFAAEFGDTIWTGIKYSAIAAAGLVDAIRTGYGYALVLASAIDSIDAALMSAQASTMGLTAALLQAAGQTGAAGAAYDLRNQLEFQAAAARETAAAHRETATAILSDVSPASRMMIDLLNQAEAAQFDLEAGTLATTKALVDEGKAGKDAADKMAKAELDAINAYAEFNYALDHMRDNDAQKAEAWRQEQLIEAQRLNEEMAGDYADFLASKERIDAEYNARMIDAGNKILADEAEARDKALKARQQQIASALGLADQIASGIASTINDTYASLADNLATTQAYANSVDQYLTDSQREALQERLDDQRSAALEAFGINKAAQIATATIQGIGAAVAAFNAGMQTGGPWAPAVAAGYAAASAIATGAQIAAIASETPAFHSGGMRYADRNVPDEYAARVLPGEFTVSKQGVSAAGGRETFDRMNAGMSGTGGEVIAITAYRHTAQVTRYERDRLAMNSPTMQEIAKGRTPGVRAL